MRRMTATQFRIMTLLLTIGLVATAIGAGVSPSGGRELPRPVGSVSLLRASTPSAPRALKVTGTNGRATLHWAGPLHTNGSPVNAYLVWPYLGRTRLKAREFHSKKTTEVVTGLTNHRKYTFRVAARNGVGIGAMSAPSAAVWVGSPPPAAGYWRPSSSAPITWNWQLQGSVPTNTGVKVPRNTVAQSVARKRLLSVMPPSRDRGAKRAPVFSDGARQPKSASAAPVVRAMIPRM